MLTPWQLPLASSQHNLYDVYLLLCLQCQTPDDGQKTCPKHIEFYSKNKLEKLVHLVGFIIRILKSLSPALRTHFTSLRHPFLKSASHSLNIQPIPVLSIALLTKFPRNAPHTPNHNYTLADLTNFTNDINTTVASIYRFNQLTGSRSDFCS